MSDYDISFVPRSEDYDPDAPRKPRKPQRAGIPRAAREDHIAARLAEINGHALARWQEGRA